MSKTIEEIYAAINPLPAKLSVKGKVSPAVEFRIEANASLWLMLKWKKPFSKSDWDYEYHSFLDNGFDGLLAKAENFIAELPSAEQAKLQDFMGRLGKLIDAGKDNGIAVDYLNPLLDTMKRLSENVITYKPHIRA